VTIESGRQLLHYRVTDKLGEGGMGVVWRAVDTNLDREVAIKILPAGFADNPERLARFDREAKLLASLNHTHIAGIYGAHELPSTSSGQAGMRFLAMELVEGEDLSEHLARGPIPVDQAIQWAREIASALEAAHNADVIHRDLKPANVKLTADGQVKVLDFGLAKAMDAPGTAGGDPAASPTVTSLGTVAGVILGTAAYMSPEQARGQDVDRRADIWSFGALLYEMLSGARPYEGGTISDTLAAVLRAEPDWSRLPDATPPLVLRQLKRCLIKDPRRRTQSIAEVRARLEDAIDDPEDSASGIQPQAHAESGSNRPGKLPWLIAAAASLIALASIAAWQLTGNETRPIFRAEIALTPWANPAGDGCNLELLSGGHRIYYGGGEGDEQQLWVRDLSQLESTPVPGTKGGQVAAVSPDEQWFAFFADGKLKKVSVNGGEPIVLAEATDSGRGGSWSDDGYIYYAPGSRHPIMRVPENGGEAEAVTDLVADGASGAQTTSHRLPQILPGGKAVLYLAGTAGDFAEARTEVRELDTGKVHVLQKGGFYPRYFDGHVGFVRDGVLHVMGFDVETFTITSPPVPTVSDVFQVLGNGGAQYDVSDNGTLIYTPGQGTNSLEYEMKWTDEDGPSAPLLGPDQLLHPRFSPDGKRIAYTKGVGSSSDVWIYELQTGQSKRLTLDSKASDRSAAWSPDGKWVAFSSNRAGGASNIYRKRADGFGEAVRLTTSDNDQTPTAWSSDGRMLLLMASTVDRGFDLVLLRLDEERQPVGEPEVLVTTASAASHGVFSPDDRYIAYVSGDDSGAVQLYVRSLDGKARWQVSEESGWGPRWTPSGRLYYHAWEGLGWQSSGTDGAIRVVDFTVENGVSVPGRPKDVMSLPFEIVQGLSTMFDIHPVDERVLVLSSSAEVQNRGRANPVLIQDWVKDLKAR
jgi:serine/threonine protein kinase